MTLAVKSQSVIDTVSKHSFHIHNDDLCVHRTQHTTFRNTSVAVCHTADGAEDQLTADVTTLATWGDSEDTTSSESDDDDDDEGDNSEYTPADEREIDEQDDGMSYIVLSCL